MASNEIGEKIYFEDSQSKVTNIRISCMNVTIPVEKTYSAQINMRVEDLCIRLSLLLFSMSLLLFVPTVPAQIRIPLAIFLGIFSASSAFWLYIMLKEYAELVVSVDNRNLVLMKTNIFSSKNLLGIKKAIDNAIMDERKFREIVKDPDSAAKLNPSETVRLKLMLEDYERMKKLMDKPDEKEKSAEKKKKS
ncbi:MAG TPA: hypothetical protein PK821_07190 [Victivallales bacterium]|nr:hypothetical protein [Victivallales bacterium]